MITDIIDIDLYQITMLNAYFQNNMHTLKGAMEAFTRKLPKNRSFLVVAGTRRIADFLATSKFTQEDISLINSILPITKEFSEYLLSINFSEEIKMFGMHEGEIAFAQEPLIRLEGPIGLLQYVEKRILSILNHDVRIASKAARVVLAAKGRPVFEAGGRRAHEACTTDTARACYIAGFEGTSSLAAFAKYGIKCVGTMGHVWVMSHKTEEEAFQNWNKVYPESTYLIDTYHPRTGTENAIKHASKGFLAGIRLDSGDLCEQSAIFRRLLNQSDDYKTKIIASNDLNEYKISDLLSRGSAINSFLVGTEVVSTPDAPTCSFVYKLVCIDYESGTENKCKTAAEKGKSTYPGRKQVYRHFNSKNNYVKDTHDVICLDDEVVDSPFVKKLLVEYIIRKDEGIADANVARNKFINALQSMPENLKLIWENSESIIEFPVEFSEELEKEKNNLTKSSYSWNVQK